MPRLGWGTGKDDDRGRSAPMQGVEYERPMDPGPFQVPNKRLHTEDPTGQSSYIPLSSHSHLAPGPLLFSSPAKNTSTSTSSGSGFSRWSYGTSTQKQDLKGGEIQDVDMAHHSSDHDEENRQSGRPGREELVDVEMYSDSPSKVHGSTNQDSLGSDSTGNPITTSMSDKTSLLKEKGAESSSSSSGILRPISLNGVKKELKRRLKDHGEDKDKPGSTSGALILREDSEEEGVGNDTIDSETSTLPPTPTIKRRRPQKSKSGLSTSHLPLSASSSSSSGGPINQYTLNMYHAPGQSMGMQGQGQQDGQGAGRGKSWVDAELPYVFIGYVQFVFNASLTVMILTALFWFLWTIWGDVKDLRGVYSTEILQEISTCTNMYLVNRCEPSTRIPAMESACQEWEHCMNRDPSVVSFTKVGAEVVAGVVGGFVDALSWRSLMALFGLFPLMIILTNSTLLNVRKKHQPVGPVYHPHPQYAPMHPGYPPQQAHFNWPPPQMGLPVQGGESGEKGKSTGSVWSS